MFYDRGQWVPMTGRVAPVDAAPAPPTLADKEEQATVIGLMLAACYHALVTNGVPREDALHLTETYLYRLTDDQEWL